MRIRKFEITGLFGIYDQQIALKLAEHITILHGLNGVGKSTVLRLLDAIFNNEFEYVYSIPFSSIRVELLDRSRLTIEKALSKNKQRIEIWVCVRAKGTTYGPAKLHRRNKSKHKYGYAIPSWLRCFVKSAKAKPLDVQRLLRLPFTRYWDFDFAESHDTNFGETYIAASEISEMFFDRTRKTFEPSIFNLEHYSRMLEWITRIAQSASRRPTVSGGEAPTAEFFVALKLVWRSMSLPEIKQRTDAENYGTEELKRGEEKLPEPSDHDIAQWILSKKGIDRLKAIFMLDYLCKWQVFQQLLLQRFHNKVLEISGNKLMFRSGSNLISPENLSAGEQHQLVLLYELLFNTEPDTLVLIDEPELSLHVGWQIDFLKDLQQVINLVQCDVLIATHSPQIINDRWDLTVQLGDGQHD